jgi:hypothetical protein
MEKLGKLQARETEKGMVKEMKVGSGCEHLIYYLQKGLVEKRTSTGIRTGRRNGNKVIIFWRMARSVGTRVVITILLVPTPLRRGTVR